MICRNKDDLARWLYLDWLKLWIPENEPGLLKVLNCYIDDVEV